MHKLFIVLLTLCVLGGAAVAVIAQETPPGQLATNAEFPQLTLTGELAVCDDITAYDYYKFSDRVIKNPTEPSNAQTPRCWNCTANCDPTLIPRITGFDITRTVAGTLVTNQVFDYLVLDRDPDPTRPMALTDCEGSVLQLIDINVGLTYYGSYTAARNSSICFASGVPGSPPESAYGLWRIGLSPTALNETDEPRLEHRILLPITF